MLSRMGSALSFFFKDLFLFVMCMYLHLCGRMFTEVQLATEARGGCSSP